MTRHAPDLMALANRPTFKAKTRPPPTAILRADDGLDGRAAMQAIRRIVAALLLLSAAGHAAAQTGYPDQAVRILVGFTPGVAPDIVARVLTDKFSESWGRPVLVENVTGAGGNIACDRVAKAPPDGYTLVMCGNGSLVIAPSLYDKLSYDPVKDFAPIARSSSPPMCSRCIPTCRRGCCPNSCRWRASSPAS
jgi:hypothetical protein